MGGGARAGSSRQAAAPRESRWRSARRTSRRWSKNVGPAAKSESCHVHHVGYIVSGRLHVTTNDGHEDEFGPGDAYEIQPDHDGWVVGDEPMISVEFLGTVT